MSAFDPLRTFDCPVPERRGSAFVMKEFWLNFAETTLLFAALFLTLPSVPSNEVEHLPFVLGFPAIALFAGSRAIRWRHRRLLALWAASETLAFAAFAWTVNAVANILYTG
jgi:hypothetical protein